jgi:hypothetical protein
MNVNILILVCFGYIFVVANCVDGIEGNTIDNLSDEEKYINDLVQKALEFGVMEFKNENALNRLKTKEGGLLLNHCIKLKRILFRIWEVVKKTTNKQKTNETAKLHTEML